jgi:hypothetical protein
MRSSAPGIRAGSSRSCLGVCGADVRMFTRAAGFFLSHNVAIRGAQAPRTALHPSRGYQRLCGPASSRKGARSHPCRACRRTHATIVISAARTVSGAWRRRAAGAGRRATNVRWVSTVQRCSASADVLVDCGATTSKGGLKGGTDERLSDRRDARPRSIRPNTGDPQKAFSSDWSLERARFSAKHSHGSPGALRISARDVCRARKAGEAHAAIAVGSMRGGNRFSRTCADAGALNPTA